MMALWDTGTGAHIILRQVVAEELTIPVEDVSIVIQDTDAVPFDSGSEAAGLPTLRARPPWERLETSGKG